MFKPSVSIDRSADELIGVYEAAARQLRVIIGQTLRSEALASAAYRQRQLSAVEGVLGRLRRQTPLKTFNATAHMYLSSVAAVDDVLGKPTTIAQAFGGSVHRPAIAILAQNLNGSLDQAVALIGRRTPDAFRRVALEETGANIAAGGTRREASAAIQRRLVEEGITDATTGFVDRAGRRWPLETYSKMAARTTTREAVSAGTVNRLQELGEDLVTISDHGPTDEICGAYAGKTFSLDGKTKGHDVIDQLPPFHPNCAHVLTPAAASFEEYERAMGSACECHHSLDEHVTAKPPAQSTRPKPKAAPPKPPTVPQIKGNVGEAVSISAGRKMVRKGGKWQTQEHASLPNARRAKILERRGDEILVQAGSQKNPSYYLSKTADLTPATIKKGAAKGAELPELDLSKLGKLEPKLKGQALRDSLVQPREAFTKAERAAIRDYTGGKGTVAELMNSSLRQNTFGARSRYVAVRDGIDSAFRAVKPLKEPGLVYRGTKVKFGRKLKPGVVIEDSGYMSTSASRNVAKRFVPFDGDLFEVTLPRGARALDINEAAGSRYGFEREVLLPRGTKMVIESIKPNPKKPSQRIIKARVVL